VGRHCYVARQHEPPRLRMLGVRPWPDLPQVRRPEIRCH